jgi:hypothetical protein
VSESVSGVAAFAVTWTGVVPVGTTGFVAGVVTVVLTGGVTGGGLTGGGLTGGGLTGGFRGRVGTVLVGPVLVVVGTVVVGTVVVGTVDVVTVGVVSVGVVSVGVVSVGVVSVGVLSVGVLSVGVLMVGVVSVGVVAAPPPSANTDAARIPSTRRTPRPTGMRRFRYFTGWSLSSLADEGKRLVQRIAAQSAQSDAGSRRYRGRCGARVLRTSHERLSRS